jgi:hypothetical protein
MCVFSQLNLLFITSPDSNIKIFPLIFKSFLKIRLPKTGLGTPNVTASDFNTFTAMTADLAGRKKISGQEFHVPI